MQPFNSTMQFVVRNFFEVFLSFTIYSYLVPIVNFSILKLYETAQGEKSSWEKQLHAHTWESYLHICCKCSNTRHHTPCLWTHQHCKWRKTSACCWDNHPPSCDTSSRCHPTTRLHTIHCHSACTDQTSSPLCHLCINTTQCTTQVRVQFNCSSRARGMLINYTRYIGLCHGLWKSKMTALTVSAQMTTLTLDSLCSDDSKNV